MGVIRLPPSASLSGSYLIAARAACGAAASTSSASATPRAAERQVGRAAELAAAAATPPTRHVGGPLRLPLPAMRHCRDRATMLQPAGNMPQRLERCTPTAGPRAGFCVPRPVLVAIEKWVAGIGGGVRLRKGAPALHPNPPETPAGPKSTPIRLLDEHD